jgi:GeoRSP system PqqD family protein
VIAPTEKPRRNPRVAARVVDGKALIVVIDQRKLHTLNEVGTRVWELCDGRELSEIVRSVVDEFDVDEPSAERDVRAFVKQLSELGALELEARP